ncbi:hypothetical protein OTU49_005980 [Cherax quadricarinatus]|uniref:Secreted protein n=1 Tax=Cherax quadricarinatus TaxID=27406 RepID=A0AAW0WTE3_CHEQU
MFVVMVPVVPSLLVWMDACCHGASCAIPVSVDGCLSWCQWCHPCGSGWMLVMVQVVPSLWVWIDVCHGASGAIPVGVDGCLLSWCQCTYGGDALSLSKSCVTVIYLSVSDV